MQSDRWSLPMGVTVVGVPHSRRVTAFCETAVRMGYEPVEAVSYLDLLAGRVTPPHSGSLVRIESPSECSATTRAILKAGIDPMAALGGVPLSTSRIDRLECDRGEMLHPRQWFFGFQWILRQLEARWGGKGIQWMSHPAAIATAFDKSACLELWSDVGLPIPRQYSGITTYAQLRQLIPDRHARIIVKLRYGYSAMGAVALEWRDSLVRAITTTEVAWSHGRPRLFVSKRPRVLTRELDIAWLIDTLAMEDIVVEDWLPKARWNGKSYDVRVVMINGQPLHAVGRASSSPFTNLNLDATRISRAEVAQHLGDSWEYFELLCGRAAHYMANARILGLDVLVRPCRRRFAFLEANAFGDYLPGVMHEGQSVYERELSEFRIGAEGAIP